MHMEAPPNPQTPADASSRTGTYATVLIWSLLMAVVVVLFCASGSAATAGPALTIGSLPWLARPGQSTFGLNSPNLLVFRFLAYFAACSLLAVRAALLVAALYLLRFLRYHLLPPLFAQRLSPPANQPVGAPEPPAPSYTLTGAPITESGEAVAPRLFPSLGGLPGNSDGASLLWRALACFVVALAVEIATGAVLLISSLTL
jgi:hypothetical protein